MNTLPATPSMNDVQQVLATAVAHHVETMSKEEMQALVNKALLDLQQENAAQKERIAKLEAEAARNGELVVKLAYKVARLEFDPEDWEKNFDPSEYSIPVDVLLADMDKLLSESTESKHG